MITTYETLFTPYYYLTLNGSKISDELNKRIISIEIEYSDDKDDVLTIVFNNEDMFVSNSPDITKNKTISIVWGYVNYFDKDSGFIIKDYSGTDTFTVFAYKLNAPKKSSSRSSSSGSSLSSAINPYGAKVRIRTNRTAAYPGTNIGATSSGSTSSRSSSNTIPESKWKAAPVLTLVYKVQDPSNIILEFDPSYKSHNLSEGAVIEGIDPDTKEIFRAVQGVDSKQIFSSIVGDIGSKLGLSQKTQSYINKAGYWIIDGITGVERFVADQAEKLMEKVLPNTTKLLRQGTDIPSLGGGSVGGGGSEITTEASLRTIGVPRIRNGQNINIQNVGAKFSGKWYIKSVSHIIDGNGYTTSFSLARPSTESGGSSKTVKNVDNNATTSKSQLSSSQKATGKTYYIIDGFTGKEIKRTE